MLAGTITAEFIRPLMIRCYELSMAKKCEQCGEPAVDALSLFCNLCGGNVRDEPEDVLPICLACGIPAPDDQSVFCTRCGLKFAAEPEDRYPVCPSCGCVIPDELAVFCNRCGTKISPVPEPTAPVDASAVPVVRDQVLPGTPKKTRPATAEKIRKKASGSVIIMKKKHSADPPAQTGAYVPEEPVSDPPDDQVETMPEPQVQKKYAHLPLVADERPVDPLPTRKYAHLPLVADELNVKNSPQGGFYSTDRYEADSSHTKKHAKKSGILGMFKR
jgi:hypothetical protein